MTNTRPPNLFTPRFDLAEHAANLILSGGDQEAEELRTILQRDPTIGLQPTQGTDPDGNIISGTLPEIAKIAGDSNVVNVRFKAPPAIQDIKQRGLFEQILSKMEKCLTLQEIIRL